MDQTIANKKMQGGISKRKQFAYAVIPILIGLIAGAVLVEIALRFLDLGYRNRPLESDPVLHHIHPKSYLFRSHFGDHLVYYDQLGLVSDPDGKAEKTGDCRIAFLGDSFTEARQVPHKRSFVGLLDNRTDCVVRNYGVASYSPIFYYLQWRHLLTEWQPDLVVVQLYSNDMSSDEDNFEKAKLDADGLPEALPGPPRDWLSTQLRKSYLLRFLRKVQLTISWKLSNWGEDHDVIDDFVEENPDVSQTSADLLMSLKGEVTAAGADFVLFAVPSKFRLENPEEKHDELEFANKWKAWAEAQDVEYIDLVEPFMDAASDGKKLFFQRDVHFNEDGHAIVANAIERTFPSLFMKDRTADGSGN